MSKKNIINKINDFVDKNITQEDIEKLIGDRFGKYSKYIIQERALPDLRDGLKPVQRRILYAMQVMGILHNKPYKKSARIAGEVMGKYHPHGDSSIYEALVRMSQDFKMNIPLIDMHGNNGSIDGDSPAAMRYTEARLSKASEFLLKDLDKKTVNLVPNFDDEELEPVVLPAYFPNLLVNGATGISAGYATKIPPHNLEEVINATIYLLKTQNYKFEKLIDFIKGPDFPTGGIVQGKEEIINALKTGQGKIIIRAKTEVEKVSLNQERIVITEIPYEIQKAELVRQIDLVRIDKNLDDIIEVRDETDQEGLRIAIDLKKGTDTQNILNFLFKHTNLQIAFNYNMIVIVNNRPQQLGVLEILLAYINHYKEVVTNRSNFLLEKAKKREHIVDGLIKMVSILDEVIKIIRNSLNKQDSKNNLCQRFDFSQEQAEAIVMLQLYRLSNTDIVLLNEEKQNLINEIKTLNEILNNEDVLKKVIEDELNNTKKELKQERRTLIEENIDNIKIDQVQLIQQEQVRVGVSKDGYVLRSNLRSYSTTSKPGLKEGDNFILDKELSTLDTLILFTNLGNYIYLPVYKIEEKKWGEVGIYINNIVTIKPNERIISCYSFKTFDTNQMFLLTTLNGQIKQINLKDLPVTRFSRSMNCMKIDDNDQLVSTYLNQDNNILIITQKGVCLRILTKEVPEYGLLASGVKAIKLDEGDFVAKAIYINENDEYLALSDTGVLYKDPVLQIPLYQRLRRGIQGIVYPKKQSIRINDVIRCSKNAKKDNILVEVIFDTNMLKIKYNDIKSGIKYGHKLDFDPEFKKAIILKTNEEENFIPNLDTSVAKDLEKVVSKETKSKKREEKKDVNEVKIIDDDIINDIKKQFEINEKKDTKKEKVSISKLSLFDDFDF